jgi:hypothetical protein
MMAGMSADVTAYWDGQAATFDAEPDHGSGDPVVHDAWTRLLVPLMPAAPARVADLGSGNWWTGGGLAAHQATQLVLRHRREAAVTRLDDPTLWGGPIQDERYLLVSRC